jgi:hypothetical protein
MILKRGYGTNVQLLKFETGYRLSSLEQQINPF